MSTDIFRWAFFFFFFRSFLFLRSIIGVRLQHLFMLSSFDLQYLLLLASSMCVPLQQFRPFHFEIRHLGSTRSYFSYDVVASECHWIVNPCVYSHFDHRGPLSWHDFLVSFWSPTQSSVNFISHEWKFGCFLPFLIFLVLSFESRALPFVRHIGCCVLPYAKSTFPSLLPHLVCVCVLVTGSLSVKCGPFSVSFFARAHLHLRSENFQQVHDCDDCSRPGWHSLLGNQRHTQTGKIS